MTRWLITSLKERLASSALLPVVVLACVCMLCASCAENSTEPIALYPVKLPLNFAIREHFNYPPDRKPAHLVLEMWTEGHYGCFNYEILTRMDSQGGTLFVTVVGVTIEDWCLNTNGPARANLDLPPRHTSRQLILRFGGATDHYSLSVSDTKVVVYPLRRSFSQTPDSLIWRYPERTFACSCLPHVTDSALCGDFQQLLREIPGLTPVEVPAIGFWPYSGDYVDRNRYQVFRYESEAQFHEAGRILEQMTCGRLRKYEYGALSIWNWQDLAYASHQVECPADPPSMPR